MGPMSCPLKIAGSSTSDRLLEQALPLIQDPAWLVRVIFI
jgi:hypothetical protein